VPIKKGWVPPVSPFGLIQEQLWPNEWRVLVACMMLNCTQRKQVEKVLPEFFRRWPDAESFVMCDVNEVARLCRPLGFANRRTNNLVNMSKRYVAGGWSHVSELPGIGLYASRAWEIICRGELGSSPPNDHALKDYFTWASMHKLGA